MAWNGDRTFPAGFEPHFGNNFSLRNFGNSVYPACQCISDETVTAVGPFYLVSMAMPGEVTSNITQNDGILCLLMQKIGLKRDLRCINPCTCDELSRSNEWGGRSREGEARAKPGNQLVENKQHHDIHDTFAAMSCRSLNITYIIYLGKHI